MQKDYINQEKIDKMIAEILKLIVIPQNVKEQIVASLKKHHEHKINASKEIKASIKSRITKIEARLEKMFEEKLDGNITNEEWKKYNNKYQTEKNKLIIQLEQLNIIDKEFYSKTDTFLSFTDNAHKLFLDGTIEQKRKIIEIVFTEITYKDKNINVVF